jgi:multisubunit Na+/H+ antiporter MnhB subunit
MKQLSGFLIVALFALLTMAAWGWANRPTPEPAWPRTIQGFAFQPYQKDQDAIAGSQSVLPSRGMCGCAIRNWQSMSTSSPCTCCPTGKASMSISRWTTSSTRWSCSKQRSLTSRSSSAKSAGHQTAAPAAAVASQANQALFLRRFLTAPSRSIYEYFVMEAFDQPWKAENEGGVGAYWGVYDVDRNQKFEFAEPIVRTPGWQVLAAISISTGVIMLGIFYINSKALRTKGYGLIAVVVYATATVLVWIVYDYSQQYLTITSTMVGILLVVGMLGVIAMLLTEAHEWAEAHWYMTRRRQLKPTQLVRTRCRKCLVHVPAYNEPAGMLIETLDALAKLDYPDFEVLVIDNNTRDEAVWRPVEIHCAKLGARFRSST